MTEVNQPLKILHIAGPQRSGSTLLEKIMGGIDGFVSLGEVRFLWERGFCNNQICSCGRHFNHCEFWQKIKQHTFTEQKNFDVKKILKMAASVSRVRYLPFYLLKSLFPQFHSKVNDYGEYILKIYRSAAISHNAHVLIDSSKHVHGQVLISIPGIDLYIIHLVRDGRATAYSWTRKKVYEKDQEKVTYLPRYHPLISTFGWFLENISAELLHMRCRHYIRIRYEDFINDPHRILKQILFFINEPALPVPVLEDHKVNLKIQHLVSGNPVRFKEGETHIKPDNQWKTAMPLAVQLGITFLAWPLFLRYGYI